jgi:hypothetical protein
MWVPTGFQEFYMQPENRQKVWTTDQQASSKGGFNHAVRLL